MTPLDEILNDDGWLGKLYVEDFERFTTSEIEEIVSGAPGNSADRATIESRACVFHVFKNDYYYVRDLSESDPIVKALGYRLRIEIDASSNFKLETFSKEISYAIESLTALGCNVFTHIWLGDESATERFTKTLPYGGSFFEYRPIFPFSLPVNPYEESKEGFCMKLLSVFGKPKKESPEIPENLEMHFWDGEPYSSSKMLAVFDFVAPFARHFEMSYAIIPSDWGTFLGMEFKNKLYEESEHTAFGGSNFEQGKELIWKNVVTEVEFKTIESWLLTVRMNVSKGMVFYSVEVSADQNSSVDRIFEDILPFYRNLLSIFRPLVSNAGFEVVWEDVERLRSERVFEGEFGYLANRKEFDFIPIRKSLPWNDGEIFVVKGFPRNMSDWVWITEKKVREGLEREAALEIHPDHVLYGKSIKAIARDYDDNVLYELEDGRLAIVWLFYSGKPQQGEFPFTQIFENFEDLDRWCP